MTLPNSNVSIMMVRNALGYPSTDLGTLCSCNKINMWAKYKPVRYNFTTGRPSNWWKGQDGNCGISYPSFNNYAGVRNIWDDNLNGWVYLKPTGGSSSPYRLGDFIGYSHEARNPIGGFWVSPDEVQPGGKVNLSFSAHFTTNNPNGINITDLAGFSEKYLGVIIFKDTAFQGYITGGQQIKNIDVPTVDININAPVTQGTMDVYPVLCDNPQTTLGGTISNTFIPFPGAHAILKVSQNLGRRISTSATIWPDLSRIEYTVNFHNPMTTGYNFLGSYAQISIYSGSSYQTSLWMKSFGTVYVEANQTKQMSGTIYPSDLQGGSTDMALIMSSESYIEAFTQEFKAKTSIVRRP